MNLSKLLRLAPRTFYRTRTVVNTQLLRPVTRKLNINAAAKPEEVKISVSTEGKRLQAVWGNEASPPSTYHSVWLRHNCQCSQCLTSYNQNAVISTDLDPHVTITETRITGDDNHRLLFVSEA